jgi:hypothetical protein
VIPSRASLGSLHVRAQVKFRSTIVSSAAAGSKASRVTTLPDDVDILVIGSGVGGLSAASLLARCGLSSLRRNHVPIDSESFGLHVDGCLLLQKSIYLPCTSRAGCCQLLVGFGWPQAVAEHCGPFS